ncbi:hypothetical protein HF086_005852 [Spodoptera exigua]|uniref:Cyclic nucleotide-binding domain-containing protein n=1 Tax=Spodoptera exigua TaxID=7107 RepID=A0A922MGE9_SPOEX|nr:hypothetical protein HF086_005852 [Spodoptera exigua]
MSLPRSETYQDPLRKRHSIGKLSKTTQDGSKREGLTATEEPEIEWSNLIFLPFHPVFKLFVLVTVFIKVMLGPIQAVYPIIYCNDVMDYHPVLISIKYSYWYLCDVIYGIDTFLHIVHRQVVDKAVRREHLPKSAFWLLVDIFSLLPLFRLAVKNPCPTAQVWPNILAFNEFLIIHQVLLKRLDRYLLCHWKYYKGADVLETNKLENDARAIYWKAQGNLSKSIISQSKPFLHADLHLIRDLSKATNYLILPKNSNMEMFGVQCKNVIWVAQGYAKTEYSDENGELVTEYFGPGSLLTLFEIFLGRVSLRSYMAYTDCELQQKLRNRIYSTRTRRSSSNNKIVAEIQDSRSLPVEVCTYVDFSVSAIFLFQIFAQSLNLAESGMLGMNYGGFIIDRINVGVGIFLFAIGLTFWFISCQSLALLVLNFRGDTIFQNSVYQLKTFLKSERVENTIIDRVTEHFRYFWHRTKGINIQQLTNERIGAVFRQDLSYYFYKKTFTILDTIIGGGEIIQRQLASVSDKAYYLPKYEIFREMDICRNICIVHRGRGDIFGQLEGVKVRPVRVTAVAEDYVDLLLIEISAFQTIITEEMRDKISRSRQAKNNFMATKNIFVEKPYDTVPYLLRGRKTIILPRNDVPLEAIGGTWYSRWLCLAWLIGPFCSSFAVLIFVLLPPDSDLWFRLYALLSLTDLIDLINLIAEFYSAELIVAKKKLAYRRFGAKKFKHWTLYLDGLSLLLPLFTILTNDWRYQLARLLRLKFFLDFDIHFCRGFSNQKAPYVLKFAIILLLLHLFTTGWILIGCQQAELPTDIVRARQLNITMDFTQWVPLDARKNGKDIYACLFVLLTQVIALSLNQLYYKIFVTFIMYLLDIWIMALAFNYAFKHFRVLYNYDYSVQKMLMYLAQNGINQAILDIVKKYTDQLWAREKGKCIVREGDTFSTTYFIHQGEVEKWFTDASGEGQLTSILYTNGYFGCISGVIRSASFRFSYYSRTVVDLVYLDLSNWEDLIESYAEIKRMLFTSSKPEKKHDQKPVRVFHFYIL